MMDRRENTLAFINHQPHDHVPAPGDMFGTGGRFLIFDVGPVGGGMDGFGVEWTSSTSTNGAAIPVPGCIILQNVLDWESVVKFPDIEAFDWERLAAEQLANFNPKTQVQEFGMWNAQFLRLTHLMGFEGALCAMIEEPEACYALMDAITDYKIKVAEFAVRYFKPDSICPFDDVATDRGPFMSPATYRELIKPLHKKFNDAVKAMGVNTNLHVCGKCDEIVPDFADEGANVWEVCQPENDLVGLAEKVGDRLGFMGGYDMKNRFSYSDFTEEDIRASVRETIDKYAPAGNYAFSGAIMFSDPAKSAATSAIIRDEAIKYGENYYNR